MIEHVEEIIDTISMTFMVIIINKEYQVMHNDGITFATNIEDTINRIS